MSKKTITINPDLFKVNNGTGRGSRKNNPSDPARPAIKIRTSNPKTKTLRSKNHVLRFIRNQQEQNYKKNLGEGVAKPPSSHPDTTTFNSDFDESLKYMISLTDEQKQAADLKNKTLKRYPSTSNYTIPSIIGSSNIEEFVSTTVPDVFTALNYPAYGPLTPPMPSQALRFPQPTYGCMKYGGTLPTYRQLHNTTQRRRSDHQIIQNTEPIHIPSASVSVSANPTMGGGVKNNNVNDSSVSTSLSNRINEIKRTSEKVNSIQHQAKTPKLKYPKQRRTVRRTFRLGKSKVHPKISVLVSNRTLRNNITTKSHLLKQTSIPEIKRFLIKKGFIKIGTSAPNDVLRKMYESASMICGEVQNHNPENLLYNYFNDVDSTSK